MESTAVQTTDDSGTGYQGEGARTQDVGSCAIAMGSLSVRPVTEYWTFHSRFKGTSAWGEGKAAFEQFVAPSRQRMALQVFTTSFMTCLVYHQDCKVPLVPLFLPDTLLSPFSWTYCCLCSQKLSGHRGRPGDSGVADSRPITTLGTL